MPGTADRYEHVGVCFLNECDTVTRLVATACPTVIPGLDGAPLPLHDPASLNARSRKEHCIEQTIKLSPQ
jgi:hypothetical protein